MFNYDGINNVVRDASGQIEFNRRKNVEQDQKLSTLTSQVNELLSQAPAGFLPQVYYGLTRGSQTYRFYLPSSYTVNDLPGNPGDAYELASSDETESYIAAVAIQEGSDNLKIIIQGDYNNYTENFILVNMRTGDKMNIELEGAISLSDASYLGDYSAENNKNKQITVLRDLETNEHDVVFASIDYSGDEVYNWVKIGKYTDGVDGKSIYSVSSSTEAAVFSALRAGDSFIVASEFTHAGVPFDVIGDVYLVNGLSPLSLTKTGNIRGPQGATGATGATGANGTDGSTPYIQDDYWYINGVSTGVKAIGTDGADGVDGLSFAMQSGLYSTPSNYGQSGNIGPDGETLQQLPTLPQLNITGKGYVVYDPLTTPLEPFYDLYFANNGDIDWTIIHPYSGIRGQDGTDGYTPYIQNNQWYINGVSTGVQATGNTGPQGATGLGWFISSADILSNTSTIASNTVTVPSGYSLSVGDIILGQNLGMGRIVAISADTTILTLSYIGKLQESIVIAKTGSGSPTSSTVGDYVGQMYLDTTNNSTYQCTAITAQGTNPETYLYTWKPLDEIKSISAGGTALTPDSSGNVNIPKLTTSNACGLVDLGDINSANQRGLWLNNDGYLAVWKADSSFIASRSGGCVITPANLNKAVKAALTDSSHLSMTSAEQAVAQSVIGTPAIDASNLSSTNIASWISALGLTGVGEYVSGYFQNGTFNTAQFADNALEAKENSSKGSSLSVSNNKVNVLTNGIYKITVTASIKYNGSGTHGLVVTRDRGGTVTTTVAQLNTIGGSGNISNEALLGIRSFNAGDVISFCYYTDSSNTIEISSTDATSFIVERIN